MAAKKEMVEFVVRIEKRRIEEAMVDVLLDDHIYSVAEDIWNSSDRDALRKRIVSIADEKLNDPKITGRIVRDMVKKAIK